MRKIVIKQVPVGPMLNLAYILGDGDAGIGAAIDPGWNSGAILKAAEKEGKMLLRVKRGRMSHFVVLEFGK